MGRPPTGQISLIGRVCAPPVAFSTAKLPLDLVAGSCPLNSERPFYSAKRHLKNWGDESIASGIQNEPSESHEAEPLIVRQYVSFASEE